MAVRAALNRRNGVDATKTCLDPCQIFGRDEVDLIEQQLVGEGDLCNCLVDHAFGLLGVEVPLNVLGVDKRYDAIKSGKLTNRVMHQEGLRHGRTGTAMLRFGAARTRDSSRGGLDLNLVTD